ncbi:DUF4145 domain-containing protein [Nocardia grenadensis]|uniref:DUF4145 domain-containing protein n=1 Tax=Nocardia grenadensis TaxID=931537 RepID=UPI001470A949|nr:DUF4145 domain-containing protein [Nocardia grenadensis]
MQKNIRKLARPFRDGDWPNLGCPVCGEGGLGVGLFEWEHQTGEKDHEDDPTYLRGRFYLRLVCGRALCTSWIIVTGDYTTDWEVDDRSYLNVWPMLTVRTIVPPIPVIELTDDVPDSVRAAIVRASGLIWLDPLAFAGALRTAVERLMDEQDILVRPAGQEPVKLHHRLVEFEKVQPQAGQLLLAAKWVGNTGAHETTAFTVADALDTAEMVEVALGVVYAKDNSALLSRASRINTAKRLVP